MFKKIDAILSLLPGDGYKTKILWIVTQIPFFGGNPALLKATEDVVANPNAHTAFSFLVQILLAIAVAHGFVKAVAR